MKMCKHIDLCKQVESLRSREWADDAAGTNRGVEFFNDLDVNDVDVNDSLVAGGTSQGTQIVWVFCQDSVSATDGWVVGQILVADAAALVGKYYITYVGR